MEASEIISAGVAMLDLTSKAIAAANAGNLEEARDALKAARDHYAKASEAWDNAAGPSA